MDNFMSRINSFPKRRPLIFLLLLALGCYGTIKLLYALFPLKDLKPDNTWIKTIAVKTVIGYGKNASGYIQYSIGDSDYREENDFKCYGMVVDEKYNILVNPKNHHEYVLKPWEPVFIKGEATNECTGAITRVFAFNWGKADSFTTNHAIEYCYTISGIKYQRDQYLQPEYMEIYKRIKKGDSFQVEYLIANPQRSRITSSGWVFCREK
jgi:hypothetical protein